MLTPLIVKTNKIKTRKIYIFCCANEQSSHYHNETFNASANRLIRLSVLFLQHLIVRSDWSELFLLFISISTIRLLFLNLIIPQLSIFLFFKWHLIHVPCIFVYVGFNATCTERKSFVAEYLLLVLFTSIRAHLIQSLVGADAFCFTVALILSVICRTIADRTIKAQKQ